MTIDPNDPRLAVNQAAELLDDEWLDVVRALHEAHTEIAHANRLVVSAERRLRIVHKQMRGTKVWGQADNAVPGRSIPNLIVAARRELGLQ